ncbi:MAG: hypothetical protein M5U34_17265 [Chloroflexi bacterium]|nr:hypothetical protein [Chloroflexota bacterium]
MGLGIGLSDPLFLLNGVGYLALIIALYFIPQLAGQRALIRWALLAFTAVTFVLYFAFNVKVLCNWQRNHKKSPKIKVVL